MAALLEGVFRSRQFVFVVGESGTEFSVHADVIANQSKALKALVSGEMAEASDGRAIFEDLDENTFIRFCQFAYTGDYTPPEFVRDPGVLVPIGRGSPPTPTKSQSSSTSPRDQSPHMGYDEDEPERLSDNELYPEEPADFLDETKPIVSKKSSRSRFLRRLLDGKDYDVETIRTISTIRCAVRENSSATEDYTLVLLGHAQLYVFAEKWGINDLKTVALHKLHDTITSFTLYSSRRRDIVELLRYAYSNEHTPDRGECIDELRSLVVLYAACEVESLMLCPEFLLLLAEKGELTPDLVQWLIHPSD